MIIMRGIALLFLLIGGALLVLGLGDFADEWINANVSCGDSYSSRPCEPGEAQTVMTLVGGIFAGVALLLLVASFWLGRAMQPLAALSSTATQTWPLTSSTVASPMAPMAPTAPVTPAAGADALVDRLARLADLRDRGVLTEAEFQAQKAKLL
jgi:putative oligomerization/nucleic acid binding protein